MTQTPRDWQKDMEMCEAQEGEQWYNNGKHLEEYDRLTEEGCRPIAEFEREEEAAFAAECRVALPYWLQEAEIYKQSYEGTLTAFTAEKARADAAEARVQRLKEEIEYEIELLTLRGSDGRAEELRDLLSTLYPDTPAPKEGSHEI